MSDVEQVIDTSVNESVESAQSEDANLTQPVLETSGGDLRSKLNKMQEELKKNASSTDKSASPAPAKETTPPEVNAKPTPATAEQVAQAVEAAYQANYKFKFLGEEKEIPEPLRAIIKDEASEKMVRELVEKSYGLDHIKPKYQQVMSEHTTLTKGLDVVNTYIQRDPKSGRLNNAAKFFETFGFTDEDIFLHAKERLEYANLPEDQRARIEAEQQARAEAEQLRMENETLQSRQFEFDTQQRDQQLRSLFQHPEVAPVIARHPGGEKAFYRDVAQHAWFIEQTEGVDMSPQQAVVSFIQTRGLNAQAQPQVAAPAHAQQMAAPQVQQPAAQVQQAQAPTLPKVPSQGTSPAKKVVSSMKDIMKRRDQLLAEQG